MRITAFETARLVHRPFKIEDLPELAVMYGDAETMRFIGPGRALSHHDTQQALAWTIESYSKHHVGLFATVEKSSSRVIGRCGFGLWNEGSEAEFELEYLIERKSQDRGYGTEAAAGFLDQAVRNLARVTPHVVALIQPGNSRAINVARNIGMTFWREQMRAGILTETYRKNLA